MANYTISKSRNGTLPLLGGVDVITSNEVRSSALIFNRGLTAIYVRIDGSDPMTNGSADGDLVVAPGDVRTFIFVDSNNPEIRIAATANLAYSIEIA